MSKNKKNKKFNKNMNPTEKNQGEQGIGGSSENNRRAA